MVLECCVRHRVHEDCLIEQMNSNNKVCGLCRIEIRERWREKKKEWIKLGDLVRKMKWRLNEGKKKKKKLNKKKQSKKLIKKKRKINNIHLKNPNQTLLFISQFFYFSIFLFIPFFLTGVIDFFSLKPCILKKGYIISF